MSPSALVRLVRSRALVADAFSPPGFARFDSVLDDARLMSWPMWPSVIDAWRLWERDADRGLVLLEDLFDSHAARLAEPGALRIECTTSYGGDTRCVHSFAPPQGPRSASSPSPTAATAAAMAIPQGFALLAAFVGVSLLFAAWIHGQHVFVNKLQ